MSNYRIKSLEKSLDQLFQDVSVVDEEDVKKAHLSRYLCVRTSGFLESVFKNLIVNYCDGTSPVEVQNYISKRAKYITNLDYKRIHQLLGEFSSKWQKEFEEKVSDKQKSSLNSVVSNRNNIAHGNSDSITYRDMKEYYKDIKEVTRFLKKIIKK